MPSLWSDFFFTNFYSLDHARLKDHVAGMEGGLEAKINEGGKSFTFSFFPFTFHDRVDWIAYGCSSSAIYSYCLGDVHVSTPLLMREQNVERFCYESLPLRRSRVRLD